MRLFKNHGFLQFGIPECFNQGSIAVDSGFPITSLGNDMKGFLSDLIRDTPESTVRLVYHLKIRFPYERQKFVVSVSSFVRLVSSATRPSV
ncbi:MAG: hypothetical protein ABII27_09455 [bacterium]